MAPKNYRFYRLDGSRHISLAEWFYADNDENAAAQIKAKLPDSRCEIWQGNRLVAKLAPKCAFPDDPDLQAAVGERLSALARKIRLGLET